MPFTAPFRRPRIYEARIIQENDQFYHGAANGTDPGKLAQVAVVDDDRGEPWATVAWFADDPSTWWLGRFPYPPHNTYPPILGVGEIIFASDMGGDLLLVEMPAQWCELATSARWPGPCAAILDWRHADAIRLWLSLVRGVQCETPSLARAVRALLDAEPARQRLRIRLAEPAKPIPEAAREHVEVDAGTVLEPYALRELSVDYIDAKRKEAAA